MAVNGIEIKVGQTWRTRGGYIVTVERIDCDASWNIVDMFPIHIGNEDYVTVDGLYVGVSVEHALDLVEFKGLDVEFCLKNQITETNHDVETLAVELLTDLGWSFDGQCWVQDKPTGYEKLADVLHRALLQASQGKGRERHASANVPFEEQPMATINRQLGSVHGFIFQSHKKSLEAMRLPAGRDVAELLGAINYLAGAVIALESWAKKD